MTICLLSLNWISDKFLGWTMCSILDKKLVVYKSWDIIVSLESIYTYQVTLWKHLKLKMYLLYLGVMFCCAFLPDHNEISADVSRTSRISGAALSASSSSSLATISVESGR